jgi:hypothetical protein
VYCRLDQALRPCIVEQLAAACCLLPAVMDCLLPAEGLPGLRFVQQQSSVVWGRVEGAAGEDAAACQHHSMCSSAGLVACPGSQHLGSCRTAQQQLHQTYRGSAAVLEHCHLGHCGMRPAQVPPAITLTAALM